MVTLWSFKWTWSGLEGKLTENDDRGEAEKMALGGAIIYKGAGGGGGCCGY